jgi:PHD/YefM family antitoxin component YafN of YafNO toxin-antitoxin module
VIIMVKTVSFKEAQATYSLSLDKTDLAQGPLILEHEGKPVAAVVPIAEYREFEAWREREAKTRAVSNEAFERERAAFERLKPELLKTHRGKFVAVVNEQVVDMDTDRVKLVLRVYDRFGYRPIYVQLVEEHLPRRRLPSVWIAR